LNILQILKQLSSVHSTTDHYDVSAIFAMEDVVGIMQHHDAITGTEKQHVADDYARIVHDAIEKSTEAVNNIISVTLNVNGSLDFKSCLLSNISVCDQSLKNDFVVAVYNPLSRYVSTYIRLPVNDGVFEVKQSTDVVPHQISLPIDTFMTQAPSLTHATHELTFAAHDIPPLGYKLFHVKRTDGAANIQPTQTLTFGTDDIGFTVDDTTGLINKIKFNNKSIALTQELKYYIGARGDNENFTSRASGAYIFRPDPVTNSEKSKFAKPNIIAYTGNLFDEIHQTFSNWARQIVRVYKDSQHIEFDWIVGPINITDEKPKEVVSWFHTPDINSVDIFYTDSNGREMIERKKNYRATYNYTNEEPAAGNYYPINSRISIKDNTNGVELSIITERPQGGSSLGNGELELMVHRRLLDDDAFGVDEALNEMQYEDGLIARGTHYLVLTGDNFVPMEVAKQVEQEKSALSSWTFVSDKTITEAEYQAIEKKHFSCLVNMTSVPDNIQILTLQPHPFINETFIVRLEHLYEKDDNSEWATNATINLEGLFVNIDITSVEETTLDGYQMLADRFEFEWVKGPELQNPSTETKLPEIKNSDLLLPASTKLSAPYEVQLIPKQIRTFMVSTVLTENPDTDAAKSLIIAKSLIVCTILYYVLQCLDI